MKKLMKKKKKKIYSTNIKSIPEDLLIDVLARVASSSFTDLFNAKLCCRDFLGVAEDNYVLEHVSIEKFPVIQWFPREETTFFLDRCKESGNSEALYRQGLVEYFSSMRMELGVEYLKRASEKGHEEASYVYGIILMCRGTGNSKTQGLKLLNDLAKSSSSSSLRIIRECRERTKAIIHTMWIRNCLVLDDAGHLHKTPPPCPGKRRRRRRRRGGSWVLDEDDDGTLCCDACTWDHEVVAFCNMLRGLSN